MSASLTRPRASAALFRLASPVSARTPRLGWLAPGAILLAALLAAGFLYAHFLTVHRTLWDDAFHDRNAHYLYALKLASSLRNGQVLSFLNELNEGRIWPPLHGIIAAAVLRVGGLDYRLAVLPSLAGWILTVLFGFLTARRCLNRGGTLAGLVAVLFIAASPAHRAYATEIMLESLGAGLSLMALYAYSRTMQGEPDTPWSARFLAMSLLALFLEKYNYWLLVVASLLLTEGLNRPHAYRQAITGLFNRIDWRRWAASQLRSPLLWSAGAVLTLSAFVLSRGDQPLFLAGQRIALYPPHNLLHIAYVLVFLRLAPWWWRRGRHLVQQYDPRWRQIVLWSLCPLSFWFLLPKRPSYFLWYLSLSNRTPDQQLDVIAGFRNYAYWFVEDYNSNLFCALLGLALFAVSLLGWRQIRPSGRAALILAVLAAALTLVHPNQKGRMLHSWIASVWVSAGIGAAILVHGRTLARWPRLRPWLAGATIAALAGGQFSSLTTAGHALEGGPHPDRPCVLDITDAYLDDLADAHKAVILTTVPLKPLTQWTFLQRRGSFDRLEEHWYGFGSPGESNRNGFAQWLRTTDCDAIVFCERTTPVEERYTCIECQLHGELKDLLQGQNVFRIARQKDLPEHACRVTIWRRVRAGRAAEAAAIESPRRCKAVDTGECVAKLQEGCNATNSHPHSIEKPSN